MTTQFFHALAGAGMALTIAVTSPSAIAHIHGTIVSIDRAHGTFTIHHEPFPLMPMSMTMQVEPVRHADLRKLHVGEVIYATVDTTIVPWPGTGIRPDPKRVYR
jgi:Cu/Ag efflux protein CusF